MSSEHDICNMECDQDGDKNIMEDNNCKRLVENNQKTTLVKSNDMKILEGIENTAVENEKTNVSEILVDGNRASFDSIKFDALQEIETLLNTILFEKVDNNKTITKELKSKYFVPDAQGRDEQCINSSDFFAEEALPYRKSDEIDEKDLSKNSSEVIQSNSKENNLEKREYVTFGIQTEDSLGLSSSKVVEVRDNVVIEEKILELNSRLSEQLQMDEDVGVSANEIRKTFEMAKNDSEISEVNVDEVEDNKKRNQVREFAQKEEEFQIGLSADEELEVKLIIERAERAYAKNDDGLSESCDETSGCGKTDDGNRQDGNRRRKGEQNKYKWTSRQWEEKIRSLRQAQQDGGIQDDKVRCSKETVESTKETPDTMGIDAKEGASVGRSASKVHSEMPPEMGPNNDCVTVGWEFIGDDLVYNILDRDRAESAGSQRRSRVDDDDSLKRSWKPERKRPCSWKDNPMNDRKGDFFLDRSVVPVDLYQDGLEKRRWNPTSVLYEICSKSGWRMPTYSVMYSNDGVSARIKINGTYFNPRIPGPTSKTAKHIASTHFLKFAGFRFEFAPYDSYQPATRRRRRSASERRDDYAEGRRWDCQSSPSKSRRCHASGRRRSVSLESRHDEWRWKEEDSDDSSRDSYHTVRSDSPQSPSPIWRDRPSQNQERPLKSESRNLSKRPAKWDRLDEIPNFVPSLHAKPAEYSTAKVSSRVVVPPKCRCKMSFPHPSVHPWRYQMKPARQPATD